MRSFPLEVFSSQQKCRFSQGDVWTCSVNPWNHCRRGGGACLWGSGRGTGLRCLRGTSRHCVWGVRSLRLQVVQVVFATIAVSGSGWGFNVQLGGGAGGAGVVAGCLAFGLIACVIDPSGTDPWDPWLVIGLRFQPRLLEQRREAQGSNWKAFIFQPFTKVLTNCRLRD